MKDRFPWLALGMGLLIAILLLLAGALDTDQGPRLPLLTMLILSEFGVVVTAVGAYAGSRRLVQRGLDRPTLLAVIGCLMLSAGLATLGFRLWPGWTLG
jgi:di/tricarboxylate transporter